MKHAASAVCLLLLFITANTAFAQVGQLCLFSDPEGLDCSISDTAPGLLTVYVVHTQAAGAMAVRFSAPKPACMTGATYLSDTFPFANTIGNSQTGLEVSYGGCLGSPIYVAAINYFVQGMTAADCPYEVLPHPSYGGIRISDCQGNTLDGAGSTTFINSNLACTCDLGDAPQLFVTPTNLYFGSSAVTKFFSIGNVGGGTLDWTVSESVSWLTVTPTSGSNSATVNVTVDRIALPSGSYTGDITIESNGGSATVTVFVDVYSSAVLAVWPGAIHLPATSSTGAFSIWNNGGGTLYWSITSDQPWLSANPPSGVGEDQVAVYVDRTGLSPGTYTGHLLVTSNGGDATILVEMIVSDAVLVVEPLTLVFMPSEPTKTFTISNGGTDTLDWSLELFDPWVSAAPMSGSGYGIVTVNVDVGSLPCCNMLLGHLRVNSNGGSEVIEIRAYPTGPSTGGSIGIYMDTAGTECNLSDATVGMTTYHVVHLAGFGMTACAYWAPKPSCFTATYLSDTNIFPVTIGNSQVGVSIGYGSCRPGPIHVQSIVYFTQGTTPQCCLYPVLGIPSSGKVEAVDCANNLITAYGVTSVINPNGACTCGSVRVEETTWGRVKSLYSN